MTKIKKQKSSRDKTLLIPGIILSVGSPILAYLLSPLGCIIFPPPIKPNTFQLWEPCDITNFWSFWVIFVLIACAGASLIAQSVKLATKNK